MIFSEGKDQAGAPASMAVRAGRRERSSGLGGRLVIRGGWRCAGCEAGRPAKVAPTNASADHDDGARADEAVED